MKNIALLFPALAASTLIATAAEFSKAVAARAGAVGKPTYLNTTSRCEQTIRLPPLDRSER